MISSVIRGRQNTLFHTLTRFQVLCGIADSKYRLYLRNHCQLLRSDYMIVKFQDPWITFENQGKICLEKVLFHHVLKLGEIQTLALHCCGGLTIAGNREIRIYSADFLTLKLFTHLDYLSNF